MLPEVAVDDGRPVFAATGLSLSAAQQKRLSSLGAVFTEECTPNLTHLITDAFRRTSKMMCAICVGASIVTPKYIDASFSAGGLLDEEAFALPDTQCEAALSRGRPYGRKYSLSEALDRARSQGLMLHGVSVYCFPSIPETSDLATLVAAAGGKWLHRFPTDPDDASVLLLGQGTAACESERVRRRHNHVYDVELLREAACTQVLRRSAFRLR